MDSLNTNYTLYWNTDTATRSLNLNEGGLIVDSDQISIPLESYSPLTDINIDNINRSWSWTFPQKQECSINTYNEAMEFTKSDEENICIKSSVLEELINHIKELEEINAKNWAGLLTTDT